VSGAVDKGNMLITDFGKNAVKKHPEWAAWFLFHGLKVPENAEAVIVEGDEVDQVFDVVIAPTSKGNWPMKKYPYWQKVVSAFPGCAIVGFPGDGGELSGDFVDYRGKTTLPYVVGLCRRAKLVICEEGGIGHVGAATGTPTVILFGGTAITKNLPPKNGHVVKSELELACRPCQNNGKWHTTGSGLGRIYHGCRLNEMVNGATRCMESISPDMVIKEANKWLSTQQ
jgi:ADP-heptose:LPS heptosyltransferase